MFRNAQHIGQIIDNAKILMQHPSPQDSDYNRRDGPRNQHHSAEKACCPQLGIEQQRNNHAQHELNGNRKQYKKNGIAKVIQYFSPFKQGCIVGQIIPFQIG